MDGEQNGKNFGQLNLSKLFLRIQINPICSSFPSSETHSMFRFDFVVLFVNDIVVMNCHVEFIHNFAFFEKYDIQFFAINLVINVALSKFNTYYYVLIGII